MIPRRISFFWSGSRLSFMRYMTLHSFRHCNPDFPVYLYSPSVPCKDKTWRGHELDDSGYRGEDYMPKLSRLGIRFKTWNPPVPDISHSQASDLFEWEILSTVGGLYCDMDVLWVKPIEPLYGQHEGSDALFCLEVDGKVCAIGFFGASPGCPVFKDILTAARASYSPHRYEAAGALAVYKAIGVSHGYTSPGSKVLEFFRARYPQLVITQAPDETLYFFHCDNHPAIFEAPPMVLPEAAVGIHWFGGGTVSQKWNHLLTADNFCHHQNTYTQYAMKVPVL